jgi:hypothetical protein
MSSKNHTPKRFTISAASAASASDAADEKRRIELATEEVFQAINRCKDTPGVSGYAVVGAPHADTIIALQNAGFMLVEACTTKQQRVYAFSWEHLKKNNTTIAQ